MGLENFAKSYFTKGQNFPIPTNCTFFRSTHYEISWTRVNDDTKNKFWNFNKQPVRLARKISSVLLKKVLYRHVIAKILIICSSNFSALISHRILYQYFFKINDLQLKFSWYFCLTFWYFIDFDRASSKFFQRLWLGNNYLKKRQKLQNYHLWFF